LIDNIDQQANGDENDRVCSRRCRSSYFNIQTTHHIQCPGYSGSTRPAKVR